MPYHTGPLLQAWGAVRFAQRNWRGCGFGGGWCKGIGWHGHGWKIARNWERCFDINCFHQKICARTVGDLPFEFCVWLMTSMMQKFYASSLTMPQLRENTKYHLQ